MLLSRCVACGLFSFRLASTRPIQAAPETHERSSPRNPAPKMRPQPNNIVKYTSAELQSYVDDPQSGVRRIADQLHIAVLPGGQADFKATVINCVNDDKIGRFDAKLNGIVLDVRNIKVLGNQFPIHTDHPELHVDLRADLHVFRPTIGAVIRGVIKHIAKGHISVTIHRVFNVAIRLRGPSAAGLQVNAEITIKVTDFDLKDTIPFIAGELDRPIAPAKGALKKIAAAAEVVVKQQQQSDSGDSSDDSGDETRSRLVATVKDEPRSDSDSDDSEAAESEPDDDESDEEVTAAVAAAIKREKPEVAQSSSDEENSDADEPKASVKREPETNSDSSSSEEDEIAVKIETPTKRKANGSASEAPKAKRKSSAVDNLLQNLLGKKKPETATAEVRTPARKSSKSAIDETLQDFSQFASPGLSSTMLPGAQKAKKTKNGKSAQ